LFFLYLALLLAGIFFPNQKWLGNLWKNFLEERVVINMSSFRDDIEKLSKQWDKALEQGIFDDCKKPSNNNGPRGVDFFGQMPTVYDTNISDDDVDTWSDAMSNLDGVLNEESSPSRKSVKKHTKKMANTNNPVYPNTKGSDSKIKSDTDFAGGPKLQKLIDMKDKLHTLKVQLTKDETMGKNIKKIEDSIDKISNEIDKISDMLNGSVIDNK